MRIFKKAATVLLCLIMFLSASTGVTVLMIGNTFENSAVLATGIADGEYNALLYEAVFETLEKKIALVIIDPEDISDIITEDVIENASPLAAASLINRIFGKDSEEWRYESDELYERITALLTDYAAETGIEYEEGSADQVYGMICDTVSAEVNVISQTYVSKVSPIFAKVQMLCEYRYIPLLIFVLSAAGVILLGKRHIKNALYNAVLPTYLAMFTVCAVSGILYHKDYLAKTVLGSETFQYFLRQVYNSVLKNIMQVTMILSALFLAMGIILSFAIALDKKGKRRHHKHHRRHRRHHHGIREDVPAESAEE